MAVHLSRLAKHYIADFLNYREVSGLPGDWREMYEIFGCLESTRRRVPLPEYVMAKEFDLCVRKDVSPNELAYLFDEGPEVTYWYKVPTGIISMIVRS
ncbi:hypothetical protein AAVH_19259 [Aphelenchoides avenae]|nr:hypothetical protein AAVH_19259 [Aphelenchus avenae]